MTIIEQLNKDFENAKKESYDLGYKHGIKELLYILFILTEGNHVTVLVQKNDIYIEGKNMDIEIKDFKSNFKEGRTVIKGIEEK